MRRATCRIGAVRSPTSYKQSAHMDAVIVLFLPAHGAVWPGELDTLACFPRSVVPGKLTKFKRRH